jgi:hypothetical protein
MLALLACRCCQCWLPLAAPPTACWQPVRTQTASAAAAAAANGVAMHMLLLRQRQALEQLVHCLQVGRWLEAGKEALLEVLQVCLEGRPLQLDSLSGEGDRGAVGSGGSGDAGGGLRQAG